MRTKRVVVCVFLAAMIAAGPGDALAGLGGYGDVLLEARREAMKVKSRSNLQQIAKAAILWQAKHGDNTFYPPSLKDLLDKKLITDPKVFLHPGGDTKLEEGKFVSDYESAFDRAGFKLTEQMMPPSLMLAWEKTSVYGDGRNAVFFDSHVEFLTEKQFAEHLKKLDDALAKHKPKTE